MPAGGPPRRRSTPSPSSHGSAGISRVNRATRDYAPAPARRAAVTHVIAQRLPGLTPRQSHIANTVLSQGLKHHASPADLISAAETGIVESQFTNPTVKQSDADSAGWRQERSSLYPNPRDVKASASRFFKELRDVPGSTPGQKAANVQRPLAQYRSRYEDVAPMAVPIVDAFIKRRLRV